MPDSSQVGIRDEYTPLPLSYDFEASVLQNTEYGDDDNNDGAWDLEGDDWDSEEDDLEGGEPEEPGPSHSFPHHQQMSTTDPSSNAMYPPIGLSSSKSLPGPSAPSHFFPQSYETPTINAFPQRYAPHASPVGPSRSLPGPSQSSFPQYYETLTADPFLQSHPSFVGLSESLPGPTPPDPSPQYYDETIFNNLIPASIQELEQRTGSDSCNIARLQRGREGIRYTRKTPLNYPGIRRVFVYEPRRHPAESY